MINTTFLSYKEPTIAYCKQCFRVLLHAVSFASQYLHNSKSSVDGHTNILLPYYGRIDNKSNNVNSHIHSWNSVNHSLAKYTMSFPTFKEGLLCVCIKHPNDNITLSKGVEYLSEFEATQIIYDSSIFNSSIWWQCLNFNMTFDELIEICYTYEGNEMTLHKLECLNEV